VQRTIHKVMLSAMLPVAAAALAMILLSWTGRTQKVHAATDSSVEFSISAPGCNSNGTPTATCTAMVGVPLTLAFNIDALPSTGSYLEYHALLAYPAAVVTSAADLTQTGAGNWPFCLPSFGVYSFGSGSVAASCSSSPVSSSYLGALFHLKVTCPLPGYYNFTLVGGDGNTDVRDVSGYPHSEATTDTLTVHCYAAPLAPVSVGGVTDFDGLAGGAAPISADASSSSKTPLLALGIAALALVATAGGAGWYARRRWAR